MSLAPQKRRTLRLVRAEEVPGVRVPDEHDAKGRQPRISGLKGFETPTLEGIERRRWELLGLTLVVLVVFAVSMVLFSYLDKTPIWFRTFGGTITALRVGVVILVLGFGAYLVDNERRLRNVSKFLINEQVLSAALTNRLKEI